jgi:hypothetical protein
LCAQLSGLSRILAALLLRRRERRRGLFQDLPISSLKVRATLHFPETLQQTLTGPSGSSSFSGISWIVAFLNVMIGKGSLDSKEDFSGEAETTALLPSSGLPSPPVPSNNLIYACPLADDDIELHDRISSARAPRAADYSSPRAAAQPKSILQLSTGKRTPMKKCACLARI